MKILYETMIADLVKYERYRSDHSPSTRPKGFFAHWGWLVVTSLHVGTISMIGWAWGDVLIALFFLSYFYCAFFQRVRRSWTQKSVWKIAREGRKNGLLGPRELELEGQSLIEVSDHDIRTTPLEDVEKIVTTDEYAFVYTGETSAFVIPRRYLSENDFQSFVSHLIRACSE